MAPSLRRQLLDAASELSVNYRNSPIVENHPAGPGPAAGDHAPDAPLLACGGTTTRLWRVLDSTKPLLIVWQGTGSRPQEVQSLIAACEAVKQAHGATLKTLVVVAGASGVTTSRPWNGGFC